MDDLEDFDDWHALGDVQYRKWKMYDLKEELDVASDRVCGAPFAGPVACVSQPEESTSEDFHRLRLFSCSGEQLADETVHHGHSRLVAMGWTDQELLLCIHEDGTVVVYDLFGKLLFDILLFPDDMSGTKVLDAIVYTSGLAVLRSDLNITILEDISASSIPVILKSLLKRSQTVRSMAVLEPQFTSSGLVEVILATNENTVMAVNVVGSEDQLLQERIKAPITKMAIAPNGRYMACFTENGWLTVMSTSFTSKILDLDLNTTSPPTQMVWCGEDSVILAWKGFILMVGPFGHWVRFGYEDPYFVVPETDCVRIFTPATCEILQRVSASTETIRRIGSTDPSAMLYDAMEAFEEGDVKADDNIRTIEDSKLISAVQACILAAGSEFSAMSQKKYLKAATYETCRKLRVLNQIRQPSIGLPLTSEQYDRLTVEVLLDRLLGRNQHQLALTICEYLKIPKQKVVIHWACEKLKSPSVREMSDESLRDLIRERLKPCGSISYTHIALTAFDHGNGRKRLATMLLDFEPNASDQVKLLLSMNENELALQKAVNSMKPDLVLIVLLTIEHTVSQTAHSSDMAQSTATFEEFFRMVYNHPAATALLHRYYEYHALFKPLNGCEDGRLMRMLRMKKDFLGAGTLAITQGYQKTSLDARLKALKDGSTLFSQVKDLHFHQRCTDEQVELLRFQHELETKYGEACFLNSSVSETLFNLIALAAKFPKQRPELFGDATRAVKAFKVPEKRFWHVKVKALAKTKQWQELKSFANERKPPIGYAPFARACIEQNLPAHTTTYFVERIQAVEERYALYVQIKQWDKALECAQRLKDPQRLLQIRTMCKDPQIEAWVEQALQSGNFS